MKMQYAAIITYTTGEKTGATVEAEDNKAAWRKLVEVFADGEGVQALELAAVLVRDREIK